jgi:prevent-host-death family protein
LVDGREEVETILASHHAQPHNVYSIETHWEASMRSVGVRELRENTTAILRSVSEQRETVDITKHGRVVARLVPPPRTTTKEIQAKIERMRRLAQEIGQNTQGPVDSSTLMREERE